MLLLSTGAVVATMFFGIGYLVTKFFKLFNP